MILLALPLIVMVIAPPPRPIRLRQKLERFDKFRRDERSTV